MAIEIKQEGRRLYITGNTYDVKDRLKENLGVQWDPDQKAWWCGTAKRRDAERLVAELNAAPAEKAPAAGGAEDPDRIRLVGKAKYKGRIYYVRYVGDTKRGYSARLISLDGKVDFWATAARPEERQHDGTGEVAVVVKHYQPRTSGLGRHARTEYTTLGHIPRFMQRLKEDEAAVADGTAEMKTCWECGGRFSKMQCQANGGDWDDGYCGC